MSISGRAGDVAVNSIGAVVQPIASITCGAGGVYYLHQLQCENKAHHRVLCWRLSNDGRNRFDCHRREVL